MYIWASLVAQLVKNPPAVQEGGVQSQGWEDPLEEEMATHSSLLVKRLPWTEEPGRLEPVGMQEPDTTYCLDHHRIYTCIYICLQITLPCSRN